MFSAHRLVSHPLHKEFKILESLPFAEHESKGKHVREDLIADVFNLKYDLSGLLRRLLNSTMLGRNGNVLFVVYALQVFDSFKLFLHPHPIPGMEHSSSTLGELDFVGYYVREMKEMGLDIHPYKPYQSQFSLDSKIGMEEQSVQARALGELIQVDGEKQFCVIEDHSRPCIHRGGDPLLFQTAC